MIWTQHAQMVKWVVLHSWPLVHWHWVKTLHASEFLTFKFQTTLTWEPIIRCSCWNRRIITNPQTLDSFLTNVPWLWMSTDRGWTYIWGQLKAQNNKCWNVICCLKTAEFLFYVAVKKKLWWFHCCSDRDDRHMKVRLYMNLRPDCCCCCSGTAEAGC